MTDLDVPAAPVWEAMIKRLRQAERRVEELADQRDRALAGHAYPNGHTPTLVGQMAAELLILRQIRNDAETTVIAVQAMRDELLMRGRMIEILRVNVGYTVEEGINDELTEPDCPLEPHWRALPVDVRAAIRTTWRNRASLAFELAIGAALEKLGEEDATDG